MTRKSNCDDVTVPVLKKIHKCEIKVFSSAGSLHLRFWATSDSEWVFLELLEILNLKRIWESKIGLLEQILASKH